MRKFSNRQHLMSAPRGHWLGGLLGVLVLALVAAGCAPAATAPAVEPTVVAVQPAEQAKAAPAATAMPAATETVAPQVLPATGATGTPATSGGASAGQSGAPALVNLAQKANFGLFLVDDKGMTLYEYTKDTTNTSTCYDQCAVAWPPLLTTGAPQAGPGVTGSLLGTTTRTDGKTQVTFSGHPLYYFAKDQQPGDISGQGVGGVWFVLSPRGGGMTNSKAPAPGTPQASSVFKAEPTPAGPAQLSQSQTAELGQFLVDEKGMTLYLYTKDTPKASNCYDLCALMWPPLLTSGAPVAGTGLNASLLGTTARTDGTMQVTYNGAPLYYWFRDQKPGDTKGQWVGGVWFVISPAGEKITAGKPATPAAGAGGASGAAPAATTAPAGGGGGYGTGGGGGYGTGGGSSNSGGSAGSAPAAAAQTITVTISNFAFAPKTLNIAAGTTVVWQNNDTAAHTVTADNGAFDSGNLDTGAKFQFTFAQPGSYPYFCRFHGAAGGQGMSGVVVVK